MIGEWTRDWASSISLNCTYFPELESTNSYAKENFETLTHPHLIITDLQIAGRGRGENTWNHSVSGSALYSTWCFSSSSSFSPLSTARIGLALYQSLSKHFSHFNFSIKAPNDIYVEDKKLAGILVESISMNKNYLMIGIGMNVLSSPDELKSATCLDPEITQDSWLYFLNDFWQRISQLDFSLNSLPEREKQELLIALQAFPSWKEPLLDIKDDGSLIFKNKTVHWSSL